MTVVWEETALDELASIWLLASSDEREQITAAAAQIDSRLRFNPAFQGESRPNERRVLYTPPLGVTFRVKDDDRLVNLLQVWVIRRR
jgi:hypothetical protein